MFVCSTAVTILPRLDFKTEAFFMKENKKNLSALLSNTMINFCELEVFIINFSLFRHKRYSGLFFMGSQK